MKLFGKTIKLWIHHIKGYTNPDYMRYIKLFNFEYIRFKQKIKQVKLTILNMEFTISISEYEI